MMENDTPGGELSRFVRETVAKLRTAEEKTESNS